ncbi:type I polyketide synthase, partial [Streptomyces sp. NPDC001123]
VRGSAVNQDGASNGLTAPNGPAQQRVIHQALANANLQPTDIDAVEAHGTGTRLGDPIEAQALIAVYGEDRQHPLHLGSVKSNIGHTQAAAGVAGIIKMIQAIHHGELPRSLHIDEPTPHVDWTEGTIALLTEHTSWPDVDRPRRAAVSSFGISGTNAHVIVEGVAAPEAESADTEDASPAVPPRVPLALSAADADGLRRQADRLVTVVQDASREQLAGIALSLATTRTAFQHRAVILAADATQARTALTTLAAKGGEAEAVVRGTAMNTPKVAFLFSGQGSQRPGMGRELYDTHPVFAEALDEVCALLDPHLEQPLREVMFGDNDELLGQTLYTQTALFAYHTALYKLLNSLGVRPDYLAGHSIGEISAAHAAGVLTLSDAARLVAARATLMQQLPTGGTMIAIQATEGELQTDLDGLHDHIAIAAINSPHSLVLSGDEEKVAELAELWRERGRRTRKLDVSHAFHSPHMNPILDQFRNVIVELTYRPPTIPVAGNVTGGLVQDFTPDYWVRHIREAVRFRDGVRTLDEAGAAVYVELAPAPTLTPLVHQTLDAPTTVPVPHPDLTAALAHLHAQGVALDWHALLPGAERVGLPTYPFRRDSYWLESVRAPANAEGLGLADAGHPLLGATVEQPEGDGLVLTGLLSAQEHPWLTDHTVAGQLLFPGAGFVELALHAAGRVDCEHVTELTVEHPLVLPERGAVRVQVVVGTADDAGLRSLTVHTRGVDDAGWTRHVSGTLGQGGAAPARVAVWPPEGAEAVDVGGLYDRFAVAGYGYGPAFQGVTAAWREGATVHTEVSLPEGVAADGYTLHPALLDAALHGVGLTKELQGEVPFAWRGVTAFASGASALRVSVTPGADGEVAVRIADAEGHPVLEVAGLALRKADIGAAPKNLYRLEWQPVSAPAESVHWVSWGEQLDGAAGSFTGLENLTAASVPSVVAVVPAEPGADVQDATERALGAVQAFLAEEALAASRLVVITRRATVEENIDLAGAAVWGLVRSAQSEHPDRLVLLDLDAEGSPREALPAALASGEPQVALRGSRLYVPRLVRVTATPTPRPLNPNGTVLITGGTGALGSLLAQHLV